jgi:poly(3-hydroxyoctanoate) depolymerase
VTQRVQVDGMHLRVRVQGSGRPLLLVMGIGGNIEMWDPLVDALDGFETIAFDAPGTGESSRPRRPLWMTGLAHVVERLLDSLAYSTVDVLGVSFGGALAQQLALQAPDRVRRLVLASTSCGLGSIPGNPLVLLALASPLRYRSARCMRLIAPHLYGGDLLRDPIALDRHLQDRAARPPSVAGYAYQLLAAAGWSSLPFLQRIRQPTLVMAGDRDPIVPLVNARVLAARIPDARLQVFRGAGHLFLAERPAEVAAVLETFLRPVESMTDDLQGTEHKGRT